MSKAKEIATQFDIPLKRAIQILSTIDPVAWAELMFGFDDSDKDWKIRSYQKEQLRCTASRTVIRGRRSGKTFAMGPKDSYLHLTSDSIRVEILPRATLSPAQT